MEEKELIMIRWHVDRTVEPAVYMLICTNDDPTLKELTVSVPSDQVTERVARARLIEKMFKLARERGIDGTLLRFQVNGIDE